MTRRITSSLLVALLASSCASSTSEKPPDGGDSSADGKTSAIDGVHGGGDGQSAKDGRRDQVGDRQDGRRDLPSDRQDGRRDLPADRQDAKRAGDSQKDGSDANGPPSDGPKALDGPSTGSDGNTPKADGSRTDGGGSVAPDGGGLGPDRGVDTQSVPALAITTPNPLPGGIAGQSYGVTFAAMGGLGAGSYRWSATLPWGALDPKTGVFSGTAPAGVKTYALTVTVTSGLQSDRRIFSLPVVEKLHPKGTVNPAVTYTAPGPTNVATLVQGGKRPYACAFYTGRGQGTPPSGIARKASDTSGCTLVGGFTSADAPGLYGFIVTVSDASGQKTYIPMVARNGSCNNAAVTLSPPAYPLRRLSSAASNVDWTLKVDPVDSVCQNGGCSQCNVCLYQTIATRLPLRTASQLDCKLSGDVCILPSTFASFVCPNGKSAWNGGLRLKPHTPLRGPGEPAFLSFDYSIQYSGTISSASACGNKTWKCHWEALEQLP